MTGAVRVAGWRLRASKRLARVASSDMLSLPLAEMVNRGGRFVLVVLLARQLGPQVYGSWVVAASLGMIIANGADLGLSTVITTRIAADRSAAPSAIANLFAIGPALAAIPGVALVIVALVLAPASTELLLPLGFGALLDSIAYVLLAPLRGCGRMRPEVALRAGQGCALLLAGVPLLLARESATAVAALFPVVGAVSVVVAAAALVRQFGPVRPRFDVGATFNLLGEAMPLLGSVVVTLIYFRADSLLIAYLRGERETGLYGAAYTLVFGVAFVPLMLHRVLLPRLAACQPGAELRSAFASSLRKVSGVGLISAAALVTAMPLLTVIYGQQFAHARVAYLVLVPALAIYFITFTNYTVLLARSRNATSLWLTLFALAVNLGANLALIRPLGATGAALSVLCSEAALLAAQAVLVRRLLADGDRSAEIGDVLQSRQPEALAA